MDAQVLRSVMESCIPFNKVLGLRVVDVHDGFVRFEIPFREELIGDSVRSAIHGGVLSALADTAGGAAVWSSIENPHARVSTVDLRIDYLRPGKPESVVAEASVVRTGRRIGVADIRLFQPASPDVTIATGKGVYNIALPKGT